MVIASPRKRRPTAHLVDSAGASQLRACLPPAWVIRPYREDYGIDFNVELFGNDPDGGHSALGEHLLVQLKSRSRITSINRTVCGRFNVEKHGYEENPEDAAVIQVLPVTIETSDLSLALSMGAAAPLMLIACDLATHNSYFLCLTDFAEKVILPRDGALPATKRTTVHIPIWNRVSPDEADVTVLRFFGKRAKLLAALNKMRYQYNEIGYALPYCAHMTATELADSRLVDMLLIFIDVLLRYDFWRDTPGWPIIAVMERRITELRRRLLSLRDGAPYSSFHAGELSIMDFHEEEREDYAGPLFHFEVENCWQQLANLGNVFEEVCREWFLPTRMGAEIEEMYRPFLANGPEGVES